MCKINNKIAISLLLTSFALLNACAGGENSGVLGDDKEKDASATATWESISSLDRSNSRPYSSVWAISDSNVLVAGPNGGVITLSNGQYSQSTNVGTGSYLNTIWGSDDNNVYAGSELGRLPHFDGTGWRVQNVDAGGGYSYVYGIWGSSASDIFLVGANGFITNYNGKVFSNVGKITYYDLQAVWGTGHDNVYAAGGDAGQAVIIHYDGVSWEIVHTDPTGGPFTSIWGSASDDVYAVGTGGRIVHFDGDNWAVIETDVVSRGTWLSGIWGFARNDVYMVGYLADGLIYHFDGTEWALVHTEAAANFSAVYGTAEGQVYAVGSKVVRYAKR